MQMGRAHSPEPQRWLSGKLVQDTSRDSSQEREDRQCCREGCNAGSRPALEREVHLLTLLRAGLGLLRVTEASQCSHGPETVTSTHSVL